MFIDWFRNSVELQNWNDLAMRVSFIATFPLLGFEVWGIMMQDKKIRNEKSGDSVSVSMFVYFAALFAAFGYFGLVIQSIATSLSFVLFFLYLRLGVTLWKIKGFSKVEEKRSVLFACFALLVIVAPKGDVQEYLMTGMMLGALYPFHLQLKELRQLKNVGSLDIRLQLVFLISTIFWTVYAYSAHNVPLMCVNPFVLGYQVLIVFHWFKYYKEEKSPTPAPHW